MRNERPAFNANPNTGSKAHLEAEERPDGPDDVRPRIVYRDPFWKDEDERLRYERAVKAAPPSHYGKMQLHEYLAEIVKLAEGIKPQGDAVKAMASGPWEER